MIGSPPQLALKGFLLEWDTNLSTGDGTALNNILSLRFYFNNILTLSTNVDRLYGNAPGLNFASWMAFNIP